MRLRTVDDALAACEEHLQVSGAAGTQIEAFLTHHLLVLICASFEQEVSRLVAARAERANDQAIASFVRAATAKLLRSIRTSEIAGFLQHFGPNCKKFFQDQMAVQQRGETYFNNIVVNRHATAHGAGPQVTLAELAEFYSEGHVVLDAIARALESSLDEGATPEVDGQLT